MIYTFDGYELDLDQYELRRGGQRVAVEPQVFDVLAHLVEHRTRVVPKVELLESVWKTTFVTESALTSRVKAARHAVGDDGQAQRMIRTVHGRGYRFVAPVEVFVTPADGPPAAATGGADRRVAVRQEIRFCRSADGVEVAYATSGDGPPLVKAAHWMSHLDYDWESLVWRHWLQELSQRHRLVRFDERGSGLSDGNVDEVSLETKVADLEAVVDACGLERFDLLGLSGGGPASVAYAARHPERVHRLVLYGAFVRGRMARAGTAEEKREAELMVELAELGWGRDDPAYRHVFALQFMPDGTQEQWAAFDELQRRTATPASAARILAATADLDVTALAPRVQAPTLVIHSRGDRRAPLAEGRSLATLIPDSRLVVLDSLNHILLHDEPAWARFVDELNAFLDN
jgi:pimeloyl-ACP methyl ester carboxylesterase/DNA-binding winged helix-turn-helix (wHTH) protein